MAKHQRPARVSANPFRQALDDALFIVLVLVVLAFALLVRTARADLIYDARTGHPRIGVTADLSLSALQARAAGTHSVEYDAMETAVLSAPRADLFNGISDIGDDGMSQSDYLTFGIWLAEAVVVAEVDGNATAKQRARDYVLAFADSMNVAHPGGLAAYQYANHTAVAEFGHWWHYCLAYSMAFNDWGASDATYQAARDSLALWIWRNREDVDDNVVGTFTTYPYIRYGMATGGLSMTVQDDPYLRAEGLVSDAWANAAFAKLRKVSVSRGLAYVAGQPHYTARRQNEVVGAYDIWHAGVASNGPFVRDTVKVDAQNIATWSTDYATIAAHMSGQTADASWWDELTSDEMIVGAYWSACYQDLPYALWRLDDLQTEAGVDSLYRLRRLFWDDRGDTRTAPTAATWPLCTYYGVVPADNFIPYRSAYQSGYSFFNPQHGFDANPSTGLIELSVYSVPQIRGHQSDEAGCGTGAIIIDGYVHTGQVDVYDWTEAVLRNMERQNGAGTFGMLYRDSDSPYWSTGFFDTEVLPSNGAQRPLYWCTRTGSPVKNPSLHGGGGIEKPEHITQAKFRWAETRRYNRNLPGGTVYQFVDVTGCWPNARPASQWLSTYEHATVDSASTEWLYAPPYVMVNFKVDPYDSDGTITANIPLFIQRWDQLTVQPGKSFSGLNAYNGAAEAYGDTDMQWFASTRVTSRMFCSIVPQNVTGPDEWDGARMGLTGGFSADGDSLQGGGWYEEAGTYALDCTSWSAAEPNPGSVTLSSGAASGKPSYENGSCRYYGWSPHYCKKYIDDSSFEPAIDETDRAGGEHGRYTVWIDKPITSVDSITLAFEAGTTSDSAPAAVTTITQPVGRVMASLPRDGDDPIVFSFRQDYTLDSSGSFILSDALEGEGAGVDVLLAGVRAGLYVVTGYQIADLPEWRDVVEVKRDEVLGFTSPPGWRGGVSWERMMDVAGVAP